MGCELDCRSGEALIWELTGYPIIMAFSDYNLRVKSLCGGPTHILKGVHSLLSIHVVQANRYSVVRDVYPIALIELPELKFIYITQ